MPGTPNTESSEQYEMVLHKLSSEHFEHLNTILDAFFIYQEKDQVRGDLWRAFPPSDKLRELRERLARIDYAYEHGLIDEISAARDAVLSDAVDMINFLAFFIRQIREGQRG